MVGWYKLLSCTSNIVKNINENDSGDVTPANGDEKENMLTKKLLV